MKKLVIGILAHVDAGKTTLSEELLYLCGEIRKIGRVDHGDAFLDTYELEKERGITIFSKQALLKTENMEVTLLDTPGHVDFSAEMERTLQVLDYAILVINGMDGVQSHTMTLWRLLERYQIPTFLFVNKMDQQGTDHDALLNDLKQHLHENFLFPASFLILSNQYGPKKYTRPTPSPESLPAYPEVLRSYRIHIHGQCRFLFCFFYINRSFIFSQTDFFHLLLHLL